MAKKILFWGETEYVSYEEYAVYGIGGDARERNLTHSINKGLDFEQMCPFCMRELKDGSYVEMWAVEPTSGCTRYYFHPNAKGEKIKIGKGCFKHIMEAYKKKYGENK